MTVADPFPTRYSTLAPKLAPIVALVAYGSWAAYSNMAFGNRAMLLAFAVQGSFAFLSTWLLTRLVMWLLARGRSNRAMIFTQCSFLLCSIPAGLHALAETPNILQAMLPGLVAGNAYLYTLLQKLNRLVDSVT